MSSALRLLHQLRATSAHVRCFSVARPMSGISGARFPIRLATGSQSRNCVPVVGTGAVRSFTVSACRLGEGASDVALSQRIAQELQYEAEANKEDVEPEFLKTFKAEGIWQIEDIVGNDEVTLTRKFGNENIRLMFSIADIHSNERDVDFDDETPSEQEGESTEEEPELPSYPIRASFSITKTAGPGALNVDTMCQEGAFIVDNASFYPDTKLGLELTADADWQRRGLYIGPRFETLDVGVQEEFEKFLQERGINESLALFIPEYCEYKEQKEYVKWLKNVKAFVDL